MAHFKKERVSRNFLPAFFYVSNPPWPLINKMKRFWFLASILSRNSNSNENYMTQSVGRTPRSQTSWWAGHCGVRLHGGQDTAESDFTVGRTPHSQTSGWAGHCGIRLHGGQDTAKLDFTVGRTPQN